MHKYRATDDVDVWVFQTASGNMIDFEFRPVKQWFDNWPISSYRLTHCRTFNLVAFDVSIE